MAGRSGLRNPMNPLSHWNRDIKPDFRAVIDGFNVATTATAVFDNRVAAEDLMKAVVEADLGFECQHLHVHRRPRAVLSRSRHPPPQRRIFARFRKKDGASGQ